MEHKVAVQEVTVRSATNKPLNLFAAIMVAAQICYQKQGEFSGMLVMETRRESPSQVVVAFVKASAIR